MSINTISELVKEISSSKKEEIKNIINNLAIPISEFEKIGSWDENHHTRNCIARTKNYELLLLCWQAGHETSIHCHNDQDCWVYLLEGAITENQFKNNEAKIPVLTSFTGLAVNEGNLRSIKISASCLSSSLVK